MKAHGMRHIGIDKHLLYLLIHKIRPQNTSETPEISVKVDLVN